jgi:hypothetical protein
MKSLPPPGAHALWVDPQPFPSPFSSPPLLLVSPRRVVPSSPVGVVLSLRSFVRLSSSGRLSSLALRIMDVIHSFGFVVFRSSLLIAFALSVMVRIGSH